MGTFGQHCRRLPLLLWKNWILRKRHWVVTTLQVLLPVILVMGFSYLNYSLTSGNEGVKEKGQMHIASKMGLIEYAVGELNYTRVAYVPSNDFTDKVIKSVDDSIKRYYPDTIIDWKGFATEASVEKIVQPQFLVPGIRTTPTDDISAAIIFKKQFNNVGSIPSKGIYSYTLRFVKDSANTRELFPAEQKITGQYEITGFTGLQLLLDQVITNELTSTELNESFVFMTMPAYGQDSVFMGILPLILVLSFILIVPTVVREIVSERQSGIKELMRIMGLPNWMHLLGWLIDSIIFLSITVTLVTFLLYFKFSSNSSAVITHGDASLGWVVIFIYCMTSVAMCIFIASFFEQPALATTLGLLVWVLTYFGLALIVDRQYHSLNIWLVAFLCFIPNLGCSLCLRNIREFESTGVGAGWKNVYETASVFKHEWLSVGHILVIMFVSMVFFLLLAMYVENIMPFTFGVRKPWYYIFTSSCVRKPKIIDSDELGSKAGEEETHGEYFESEPTHISPGVEILHLAKEFGNGKIAVNNLSLNIFKGQITALLGHNGAGKTTTMSILTGIISPTRGTALIDGHNIRSDMEGARQNMGLCPQQNMLFDRLTVKEHLLFFAKLKGTNRGRANLEIEGFLNQLDMRKKMNAMSKALSGGQKRKLNLAMALVGGSRVVILDEPTSGMDPESRRAMWDLLMAERGRRTILLTTHLMEEADVLGDRIAIMAEGRLKCCGSPTFLKNKYGAGYTIRMTLKDKAKADKILSTVQNHVTNASFKGMPNSLELAVILPSLEDSAVFPSLFSDLESNKEKLGIQTVGLSLTTMDEIFMKVILMDQNIESAPEPPSVRNIPSKSKSVTVTESKPKVVKSLGNEQMKNASRSNIAFREESQTASLHPEVSNQGNYPRESKSEIHVHEPTKRTGSSLGKLHFYAILMKRVHYSRRNLKIVLIQLILSLVLVIWTIVACNKYRSPSIDDVDRPPLQFTLSSYSDPVTPYRDNGSIRNLGGVYAEVVGKSSVKLAASGNFHDYLKSKATEDLVKYRRSYIVGADLDNALMNVSSKMQLLYYSTLPNHALPLAANIISNTFLRLLSRNISGGDFSIDANNHPLPSRYRDMSNAFKIAKSELKGFSGFSDIFLSLISVGLAVVAAFLVIFPAEERITKAKHLQLMTGVNVFIFWGTSLLWDFFVLFVIICILLCCFPIFETSSPYIISTIRNYDHYPMGNTSLI
ncbi:unnamed protein product [Allacma fusca]|uniref:ABC transporter domain-containing protein n=1 Tax=Allacma fusca TaxID=39272 RepID=A0A8J2NYB5_9HEXA|nr:unnamed protein product [Allacma fusca]